MRKLRIPVYGLLLLAFTFSWGNSYAQTEERRYYPQTGHEVRGEFLQLYLRAPNPEFVYGYPITDEFIDSYTYQTVQYFQRARFERDPSAPPGQRVRQSNLGDFIYRSGRGQPLEHRSSTPDCRYYPNRGGHRVCYAFLKFFDEHGGVEQFGYPISDFEFQDDRIVQYFERARFVWIPEMPVGQKVQLSDVGWIYFNQYGEDPAYLLPNIPNNAAPTIFSLRVRAFPDRAVVSEDDRITLDVIVQDQNFQPVPGALVTVTIRSPSGVEIKDPEAESVTNKHGLTRFSFEVSSGDEIGIVEFWVTATYGGMEKSTVTSFRLWW